ncbi:MAG: hypothetical protein LBP33_12260 [Candidatus Adiutrix sp.]|jgi:uncharacterized membrane protein|nr:hypothetical protein [Candidatus Adiutrix sp.]
MPTPPYGFIAEPEFTVGSVLSRTFSTLLDNPLVFFGLPGLAALPEILVTLDFSEPLAGFGLVSLFSVILNLIMQGAVAYAVCQALRGQTAPLGESLSKGLTRIIPLTISAVLSWIVILLGFIFLIVPGFTMICLLSVTIPACVVERLGPVDSINRSAELTKGYRFGIFALFLIAVLVWVLTLIGVFAVSSGWPPPLALALPGLLFKAISAVMAAIIYYDLRAVKEGVSL